MKDAEIVTRKHRVDEKQKQNWHGVDVEKNQEILHRLLVM